MYSSIPVKFILFCILFISTVCSQEVVEGPPYLIGVVKNRFLKYKIQDEEIYNGTLYFANWVNKQGGLKYLL